MKAGGAQKLEERRVFAIVVESKTRDAGGAWFLREPGLLVKISQVWNFEMLGIQQVIVSDDRSKSTDADG
jgi:hypothetical protein